LILLAFTFPVAVYLVVLGSVNRRRTALLVSGVWDFAGLLAAASGFLLLGGPAILTSLSQSWRDSWLFGRSSASEDGGWMLWALLSAVYFVVVVAGAAVVFWYQRHLTVIYNVAPDLLQEALASVFGRLGLRPVKTGTLYVFGVPLRKLAGRPTVEAGPSPEGIQAPHHLATARAPEADKAEPRLDAPPSDLAAETAVLEVHTAAWLWHASLRWDPAHSNLRREVEAELERTLAETPVPEHDLGAWLTIIGFGLLSLDLLGLFLLLLFQSGR
jgi:hypothetical protein